MAGHDYLTKMELSGRVYKMVVSAGIDMSVLMAGNCDAMDWHIACGCNEADYLHNPLRRPKNDWIL
jgi:hypothetical protein